MHFEALPKGRFRLLQPLQIHTQILGAIDIPAGYVWRVGVGKMHLTRPSPGLRLAALVHDQLYEIDSSPAALLAADRVFIEILARHGTHPAAMLCAWVVVRGWAMWRRFRPYRADRSANQEGSKMVDSQIKSLLRLIREAETRGRYDVAYGFNRPNHKTLTAMTVAEVRAYQEGLLDGGSKSTAVGAYQIIRKTLAGLIDDMAIDAGATVFDQETQDAMAIELLRRRGLGRFVSGLISWELFAHNISKEWASFPRVLGDSPETSFYAGDGLNHAQISVSEVRSALDPGSQVALV